MKSRLAVALTGLLVSGCSIAMTAPVAAQITDPLDRACRQNAQSSSLCQNTNQQNPLFGPKGIITRAIQLLIVAVGVAAVIMIIIGGIKYIVASGDPSNVESARNTVYFALIGLVIALVAQAIVSLVLRRL